MTTSKPTGVMVSKIGDHGKNKRVWIVNNKLKKNFKPGEKVTVQYNKEDREIVVNKSKGISTNTISQRKNGTPILDLKNSMIADTLGSDIEKVDVLFFEDKILIKISKTEESRIARKQKKGLDTFELFSGFGGMSHHFTQNGFKIRGCLEREQEYISLFLENNDGDEVYSICGDITEVDTSYFPKTPAVVLCGIPCLSYSLGNKKLVEAKKNKREGKPYDEAELEKYYQSEAILFFVLNAIKEMNPKCVIFEQVEAFSREPSSYILRSVLQGMKYHLTETVAKGSATKRKRWTLVANMGGPVNLEGIEDEYRVGTIEDHLEIKSKDREWKHVSEFAPSRLNPKIGIRGVLPTEASTGTFTCHGTRGSEPILQSNTDPEMFSEFTPREIANIHGFSKDILIGDTKTLARKILGQSVTDMFGVVARRVKKALEEATISMPNEALFLKESEKRQLTLF